MLSCASFFLFLSLSPFRALFLTPLLSSLIRLFTLFHTCPILSRLKKRKNDSRIFLLSIFVRRFSYSLSLLHLFWSWTSNFRLWCNHLKLFWLLLMLFSFQHFSVCTSSLSPLFSRSSPKSQDLFLGCWTIRVCSMSTPQTHISCKNKEYKMFTVCHGTCLKLWSLLYLMF